MIYHSTFRSCVRQSARTAGCTLVYLRILRHSLLEQNDQIPQGLLEQFCVIATCTSKLLYLIKEMIFTQT